MRRSASLGWVSSPPIASVAPGGEKPDAAHHARVVTSSAVTAFAGLPPWKPTLLLGSRFYGILCTHSPRSDIPSDMSLLGVTRDDPSSVSPTTGPATPLAYR